MKMLNDLTLTEFVNVKEPPVREKLTGETAMSVIRQHLIETGEINHIAADDARRWIDANFRTMTLQDALDQHGCASVAELQEKVTAWFDNDDTVIVRHHDDIKIPLLYEVGLKFLGKGQWKAYAIAHPSLYCEDDSADGAIMDLCKRIQNAVDAGMELH